MFTGIIERTGDVHKTDETAVWVAADLLADAEVGGSVAVNGVCLTVTERHGDVCRFDLSRETLERSTLGDLEPGDTVNLERPLRAGDELGGHIVQGHVDAVGRIERVEPDADGRRVTLSCDPALLRYVVEKGSITVDGVSLTVTRLEGASFEVALVPHTLEVTTLGEAAQGGRVNLEVDVLAKYVERLVEPWKIPTPSEAGDTGYL